LRINKGVQDMTKREIYATEQAALTAWRGVLRAQSTTARVECAVALDANLAKLRVSRPEFARQFALSAHHMHEALRA
jgi:hypothetical protein